MTDPDPPDDLETLLSVPAPERRPDRREALFRRAERLLTRGRWLRRAATGGLVAAVFGAGGLAGWLSKPDRVTAVEIDRPGPPVFVFVPLIEPVPVPAAPPAPEPPPEPPPLSASAAELLAEQADDRAEAARLYRLAGDKYLADRQDYRNAARCYRLFLARTGDTELSPAPGDTWLLTSLKNAAFKEKPDATKSDG